MNNQTTSKKVKIIGSVPYINAMTGEVENFQVTQLSDKDFNFHKIWMKNFIATLDIVGNQKTRLSYWIIENLNKENQLCYTYRDIAKKTGISLETVRITMKILIEANFLKKIGTAYVINPDIIFKGTRTGRLNVLNQYFNDKVDNKISDDKQIENIKKTIEMLQKKLEKLENKKNHNDIPVEEVLLPEQVEMFTEETAIIAD